ncbi:MAG TPA: hypothetical protein VG860_07625 [Terriglobia bacterium]|jgi:hypothetical protein|nr:hypothetical protein [Terriglobia bacterium]
MNGKTAGGWAIVLILTGSLAAGARNKEPLQRGMLVKMDSMGCGVHEKGVTGVGSVMATAGVERVTTEDKLCADYVLRTDTMEYHIRPMDKKHPVLLPVGHEGLFRIAKDRMFLRVSDEDSNKMREYQVISASPLSVSDSDHSPSDKGNPRDDDRDRADRCH